MNGTSRERFDYLLYCSTQILSLFHFATELSESSREALLDCILSLSAARSRPHSCTSGCLMNGRLLSKNGWSVVAF